MDKEMKMTLILGVTTTVGPIVGGLLQATATGDLSLNFWLLVFAWLIIAGGAAGMILVLRKIIAREKAVTQRETELQEARQQIIQKREESDQIWAAYQEGRFPYGDWTCAAKHEAIFYLPPRDEFWHDKINNLGFVALCSDSKCKRFLLPLVLGKKGESCCPVCERIYSANNLNVFQSQAENEFRADVQAKLRRLKERTGNA